MSSRSTKYMFQYSGLVLLGVPISNAEDNRPIGLQVKIILPCYAILKGIYTSIVMISPDRNRYNFQILAYVLTIHPLYGTGCLSYWFCYYMLRLDSSEMLPGSQKGEEAAQILNTAIVIVALATRNDHVHERERNG